MQPSEEQRSFGQFPQLLGPAAQAVPEDLGVGPGGGDVLSCDDVLLGAVDQGGERGTATVVVIAFLLEGTRSVSVRARLTSYGQA
jgi:hypothetical protein